MRVLVTGARGFVGLNLVESLKAIRDGKDRREKWRPLLPLEVYEYDLENTAEELAIWCHECDFVIHLAGINRPIDGDFSGNIDSLQDVLSRLEWENNDCPILLSSSAQASLSGRFAGSEYGRSKLEAEEMLREFGRHHGSKVLVYRFPNLYGKWCRPRYNSVVATFCDAVANEREYTVNDPSVELELLYIDDLVEEVLGALLGEEHRCGYDGLARVKGTDFCYAPNTNTVTVGEVASLLQTFKESRSSLSIPEMGDESFEKKLYSTYLTYLPFDDLGYRLVPNQDRRGSFTEVFHTDTHGQVSVNITSPGAIKGNHWHKTKWEKFLVLYGEALIKERRIGLDENGARFPTVEFRVNGGDRMVVEMVPGMTHSIQNVSVNRDLVTLIWANEPFDALNPDTFYEEV